MNLTNAENNSKLISRLEKAVKNRRISHAYIFEGPLSIDKTAFAKGLVKGVLCPDARGENCGKCQICHKIDHDNHEDLSIIEKDGLSIKDAAIESIQEKLNVKPLGSMNVIIIRDCDTMTDRAQNRLLKTLEEPPGQSLLILLSENMENLAQTILSRCVKFRIEGEESAAENAKAAKIIDMCLRKEAFYRISKEMEGAFRDRSKAEELLDYMEIACRNLTCDRQSGVPLYTFDELYEGIHAIEECRQQIRKGMSPAYSLKNMILKMTL